jgi:Glu-tRNA(Gln) amidotransferase subunit E-like FAD-binding protein
MEKNFGFKNMKITKKKLRELIIEELTADDKSEIKKIASKEAEDLLKSKKMKDMVAQEVEKSLNSTASKEQIGDITKKVLKKLYKDLSLQHPYIIDRIKV